MLLNGLISCQPKVYDVEECNRLSIKSFKGSPKALNELNKNCSQIKYKYTKKFCQKILSRFILTGSQVLILKEFGPHSLECLTETDLKTFSTKSSD